MLMLSTIPETVCIHAGGQCNYGHCLYRGFGVPKDLGQAVRSFKLPSDQGDLMVSAIMRFAFRKESEFCLKLPAEHGNAGCQYYYVLSLLNGTESPIDFHLAADYFKHVADQNHVCTQYNSGFCLLKGIGVSIDHSAAVHYLQSPADQGHADSERHYGVCLLAGWGVSIDLGSDAHYFNLSADQSNSDGRWNDGICLMIPNGDYRNVGII